MSLQHKREFSDGAWRYVVEEESGESFGSELAYAELDEDVTLVSGSEAAPTGVLSAGPITFDGETRVCIEFYCFLFVGGSGTTILNLWDDTATDLGRIAFIGANTLAPCLVRRFLTPDAGEHTYRIRGWTSSGGNGQVAAGGSAVPAYVRITTVDSA